MCASTGCQRRSSLTEGRRTLFSKKSFLFLTRLFNVLYLLGIQQGSKRFRLQKRLLQIVIANCNCASFQFSIRILCLAITLCTKTRPFYERPSFFKRLEKRPLSLSILGILCSLEEDRVEGEAQSKASETFFFTPPSTTSEVVVSV